jgi:hypothetical protein
MVGTVAITSLVNSLLYRMQRLTHGRRIDETRIEHPPIFIIGHWRSGTTYLHELLVCDDRFGYPTTYECFAPHHFLLTGSILPKLLWFLVPSKRPMDNMAFGFDRPQEDELALCAMGAPTPYFRMAFPNHPPVYMEMLNTEGVDPEDLSRFRRLLVEFVKRLTYRQQRRLVLKSPPHTGRIRLLAELFPGAKFIHVVRDPQALFASTVRLWEALDAANGFQIPHHRHLEELIFTSFERMYDGFESQRPHVDSDAICDVRYEDLIRDPMAEIATIYDKLQLGGFQQVRGKLSALVASRENYRPNEHALSEELVAKVEQRWSHYCQKYGYRSAECRTTNYEGRRQK